MERALTLVVCVVLVLLGMGVGSEQKNRFYNNSRNFSN